MILSHKHKFILFCNPKTGSTSLEKTLEPFQEGQAYNLGLRQFHPDHSNSILFPNKHIPPLLLRSWLSKDVWDNYFKMVFVRNPWDWFVSEWKYHFQFNRPKLFNVWQKPRSLPRYLINYQRIKDLNSKEVFTVEDVDYLFEHLKKCFPIVPNSPGLYQSCYVYNLDGDQLVDFVGRFENIESDFNTIKDKLGLDISLPHLNSTTRSTYKTYFTEDSKRRVAQLWQKDISNFGYKFE